MNGVGLNISAGSNETQSESPSSISFTFSNCTPVLASHTRLTSFLPLSFLSFFSLPSCCWWFKSSSICWNSRIFSDRMCKNSGQDVLSLTNSTRPSPGRPPLRNTEHLLWWGCWSSIAPLCPPVCGAREISARAFPSTTQTLFAL